MLRINDPQKHTREFDDIIINFQCVQDLVFLRAMNSKQSVLSNSTLIRYRYKFKFERVFFYSVYQKELNPLKFKSSTSYYINFAALNASN